MRHTWMDAMRSCGRFFEISYVTPLHMPNYYNLQAISLTSTNSSEPILPPGKIMASNGPVASASFSVFSAQTTTSRERDVSLTLVKLAKVTSTCKI